MASETGTGRHAPKSSKEPTEHHQTQSAQGAPQNAPRQSTTNAQGPSHTESRGESERSSHSPSARPATAKSEHVSGGHAQQAPGGDGEMKKREHREREGNIHQTQTAASPHGSSSGGHGESSSEPLRKAS